MTKPAIVHICLSRGWGGLEMYPIRTGKAFIQRGYKVYGLCTAETQVAKGMQEAGIETFEVANKGQLISSQLFKLNKWLKQRNVEVVHCHKSGDILVSALLDLITKRNVFFTEHMGVTRPKRDLYHRWAYSHINQVLSISDETYQRNLKALPIAEKKISRLWLGTDIPPNPIDNPEDIAAIKAELGLPSDSTIIGNVGRICSGKGQMELLEAFILLKDNHPKLHLMLVGGLDVSEGSDNAFVEQLKNRIHDLNLSQRVHLMGFRKDTNRMLAVMNIVCMPNHNEAFGLTAIEAMAAKKAIVGANTGALPEILAPVALLCDPLSPAQIAANIEQYLLSPPLAQQHAELAFKRAQQDFSTDSHIEKLERYYQKTTIIMLSSKVSLGIKLRNKVRLSGSGHQIKISSNSKVRGCQISIKGNHNQLIIEEGVNLRDSQIEIDGTDCILNIGMGSVIGHNCYLSARENGTQLVIGKDCMLSRNVKIMTSDGHDILSNNIRVNNAKSIKIGDHVWLADNVTILKGCHVGDKSIVGINATLTKDLAPSCIAVGNPAKCVQENITWQDELTY